MSNIKDFDSVSKESTCQKRPVVCEIFDIDGNLLSRESNRCNPTGGICHRLGLIQDKVSYDVESSCNWTHAEIMAIKALPKDSKPYKAIIYGHTFFCSACEARLKEFGVVVFEIG